MVMYDFKCSGQYARFTLTEPKPKYEEDISFKPKHIKLILDIDMKAKVIKGECITKVFVFENKDKIKFNAVGMRIISVKIDGKKADFVYNDKDIEIKLETEKKEIEVSIYYSVNNPKRGAHFKDDQVWTHSETEDARYWYPCLDLPENKSTFELIITVDKEYFALSNGDLVNIEHGVRKTFHWSFNYPNPSYLNMFAIGRFVEVKDKWQDVDVLYYCEKGREEEVKRSFGKTPLMLDFFSKKIGVKYPFKKYAQVLIRKFSYGGMEHTTATSETDSALQDDIANTETPYYPVMLASHELAHQWFGDLLTCKNWKHAWLNEGFASYFEILFSEHLKGKDYALYELYRDNQAYFDEDKMRYRRPIVTNLFLYPEDVFDRHLYQKGSAVLHMLRNILGDEVWWKVIHHYVKTYMWKNVETQDFIHTIREITGLNMRKFFDQWVYNAGHPELRVSYYWDGKEAVVRVAQTQTEDSPIFAFPVVLDFDGVRFKENIENKQHLFKYKLKTEPKMFRFDPDQIILKKVETLKPKEMWIYQLHHDENILGRIQCAQELAKSGSKEDIDNIKEAFLKEKIWGAKIEFATALGTIQNPYAYETLIKLLNEKDHRVKKSVLEAIGNFRSKESIKLLKKLIKVKDSYIIPAEAIRSIGKTRELSAMSLIKTGLKMKSWSDSIRCASLDAITYLQSEESFKILKDATDKKYSQNSRLTAIRNLTLIGKGRKDVLDLILQLAEDELELVQISSTISLGDLGDERSLERLKELSKGDYDRRVKRLALESIKKIQPWETLKDE